MCALVFYETFKLWKVTKVWELNTTWPLYPASQKTNIHALCKQLAGLWCDNELSHSPHRHCLLYYIQAQPDRKQTHIHTHLGSGVQWATSAERSWLQLSAVQLSPVLTCRIAVSIQRKLRPLSHLLWEVSPAVSGLWGEACVAYSFRSKMTHSAASHEQEVQLQRWNPTKWNLLFHHQVVLTVLPLLICSCDCSYVLLEDLSTENLG